MARKKYPIPVKHNLVIMTVVLALLLLLLWLSAHVSSGLQLFGVCLSYGIVMTTGYSIIHEAEHNLLHPNKRVNDVLGAIMALFFPAPFHLLRLGHLGHHLRNRSDDEAFDHYFEGDNRVWKCMVLYGTMTGFFWLTIFVTNFLAVVYPKVFQPKFSFVDRPTRAFQEAFNPSYISLIRLEACLNIIFHGLLIYLFSIPLLNWFLTLFGFGFLWSAMQYVHHYGTERDVQKGAKNLKTLRALDAFWLNHNWHLNHHMRPTIPWIYLPNLYADEPVQRREGLIKSYIKMWRGPRLTNIRVENRFAGKIIK